ncbi:hypothetical protein QCA50_004565 [Cerrena zonata]|uniref:Xylanolytic transcriptional activator regulatory domain-containing protein n=1 Tax=Cerrena zonata TaxID=2478898 RepID=A0AAW0GU30_9APHY
MVSDPSVANVSTWNGNMIASTLMELHLVPLKFWSVTFHDSKLVFENWNQGPQSPTAGPSRSSRTRSGSTTQVARQSSVGSGSSDIAIPSDPTLEPHPTVVRLLVSIFVPIAPQVGFFLNLARFLDAVYIADPALRRTRLSPCLLDTVLLWGARISSNTSIRAHEDKLLGRAVQSISDALPQVASLQHNAIHVIQAEVLLSNYFFCKNRYLEGTYHCSAAVALAMSCKLHRIRSTSTVMEAAGVSRLASFTLPPPIDGVEEGERICAFWSVFTLDRSWSVAQGTAPNDVFSGVQIDTPWPTEMAVYEERGLSPQLRGSNTIYNFFNAPTPQFTGDGMSSLALKAKSAALFERATRLASQWSPTMPNFDVYYMEVLRLDALIQHFTATLVPVNEADLSSPEITVDLLLTHTYAHAASVRLHTRLEVADSIMARRDVSAARSAVIALNSVDVAHIPFVDPIFAMLWTVVGQALIGGLYLAFFSPSANVITSETTGSTTQVANITQNDRRLLVDLMTKVLNTMKKLANVSPLMTLQASYLDEELQKHGLTIASV